MVYRLPKKSKYFINEEFFMNTEEKRKIIEILVNSDRQVKTDMLIAEIQTTDEKEKKEKIDQIINRETEKLNESLEKRRNQFIEKLKVRDVTNNCIKISENIYREKEENER